MGFEHEMIWGKLPELISNQHDAIIIQCHNESDGVLLYTTKQPGALEAVYRLQLLKL